ncbi:ROK family protein [Kutzneria sp. NPDC052558]|uniref:ROK family transcriptional regulator n=1 Tax=Kutzneria sp. NPDC052558 TaxID=3364121 RepID=UPI0037CB167C
MPRLKMLRELTDRAVLAEVFTHGRVTRVDLADRTGISRPTISESVRRLEAAGLLTATGSRETGQRGRIATFYELGADTGHVIALELNQFGVHAMAYDLRQTVIAERRAEPGGDLVDKVRAAIAGIEAPGPLRAVAVSVANPVDPATRAVIPLAGSPFPEGFVRLDDVVDAPLVVDNDVNWAALAERRAGAATEATSFAYVHVGAGIGMSLCLGDQLIRGAHGLAGEIGYLKGDNGLTLTDALLRQGFGTPPAIDVPTVLAGDRPAFGAAIGRAVAAACTVFDPELVLFGGPLGGHPEILPHIRAALDGATPAPMRVAAGEFGDAAPIWGAVAWAVDHGRERLLA